VLEGRGVGKTGHAVAAAFRMLLGGRSQRLKQLTLMEATYVQYARRAMARLVKRAHARYRYYLYWRAQESRSRRYSAEQLEEIQWRRLKHMLAYAYDRIPMYRERFEAAGITPDDINTRDDLLRIPVLTKDDIRQNFPDRMLEPGRRISPDRMGQTSGSTSESLHFVRPGIWQRSLYYSVFQRMGGIRNIPCLVLATPHCTAATCSLREDEEAGQWVSRLQSVRFLKHLDRLIDLPSTGDVLSASAEYMERLRDLLLRHSPCMLIADPVYLAAFARYLRRQGGSVPQIVSIVTTYELLTGSISDLLREVFGCDIYTMYGASEVNDIAYECEHHRLHVRSGNVVMEVMHNGRPARPGEIGRAVVTDLDNFNMPFIRYDIGDVLAAGDGPCPCGRNTETVGHVQGRVGDLLEVPAAGGTRLLTPLQVDDVFRGVEGVAFYRLVQLSPHRYRIGIMPDEDAGEPDVPELTRRCKAVFGDHAQIQTESVEEIKPQPSMKFRFVYSEMPVKGL